MVERPHLLQRLDRTDLPPVVLVSAPAGFGKTTLLCQWLDSTGEAGLPTAWLSLDGGDRDPMRYWSSVVAAIRAVAPAVGTEATATLQASPSALEHVVASLVNDLAGLSDDLVLVLDDYHVVESVEVHESMCFLIDHLPASLHLVAGSRADPPWPLARLRARGDLVEVRAADLRFTSAEAATYLTGAGLDLSPADVDALADRTEGWIAALQLAAISLRGRDDPSTFISEFAGDDRFVVDYLVDEVLDRQPAHLRRFLLETSILSRLTAPLCAAVTGRPEDGSTLDVVERTNLFLIALDDRRTWYRYHHLFGEVLRNRLTAERRHGVAELHRRASAWLEEEGDPAEAIRHALAARDVHRVADLVELALPAVRRARQDATQRRWLDALPEEVFANRPVLNLGRVGARMVTGEVEGVEALLDDIEGWLDPDRSTEELIVHDHDGFRRLPAQAAMYRAALALRRGDLAATVVHGERTVGLSASDDHVGRGGGAALIGLARWSDGDLEAAAGHYAAAIADFETAEHFADILGCSLGLADIQVALGRLEAAASTLDAGLDLDGRRGPLRGSADMHVALAEIDIERNDLAAAADHLRLGVEPGEWLALPQHAYRWRVVEARLRSIGGDHDGARELLRDAERRYDTDYSPPARPVAATTARARLMAGDLAGAQGWAVTAGVDVDDELTYLREYEHLTLGRVLIAADRATEAAVLLERLLVAAEAGGRAGSAVEAGALLAVARQAGGDTEPALTVLEQALSRARSEGFVRVFLDAGAAMTALLEEAVRRGRAAGPASTLLAAGGHRRLAPSPAGLVDELSSRELDVLRLLRTELTGPEIAAELFVSLNTLRTHTKHIYRKLGVTSRRAAVRRADELGL